MAELLKGKPVADSLSDTLATRIESLKRTGITPKLAIIRIGEREDDLSYERGIAKRFETLGIGIQKILLSSDCSQKELADAIEVVNNDSSIHGCLPLRPLPNHLDELEVSVLLDPKKDVDGMTYGSIYGVFANKPVGYPPCTADACMKLLNHYGIELEGANVVVVGRSLVIGKPLALMLTAAHATVSIAHTRTKDISSLCKQADILVVASGHKDTIGANDVREGQVVIDVGINWDEDTQKLCGDVAFDQVEPIVAALTPVPGGIGSVTTAILAEHVVSAAERSL